MGGGSTRWTAASSLTGMRALTHMPNTASVSRTRLRISGDRSIMQRPLKVFPIGLISIRDTRRTRAVQVFGQVLTIRALTARPNHPIGKVLARLLSARPGIRTKQVSG